MYDTQPISKKEEWISKPYDAEIKNLPPPLNNLGKCIISRGSYNSKAPLISFLSIVSIQKKNNSLPISLLLLFDGEEEIGSPTLFKFLKENREMFKNINENHNAPAILMGQKELRLFGFDTIDVHFPRSGLIPSLVLNTVPKCVHPT